MNYQHLTIEEREKIQERLWEKVSLRAIAKELNRSPSSLSRELARHLPPQVRRYTPRVAHERALKQRKSRGRKDRLKNEVVRTYVTEQLKEGWSPEQVSGCIFEATGEHISHEAIYQYVYHQVYQAGYGYLKPGCEDLRPYLRRKQKRRRRKGQRRCQRVLKPHGPSIEERPAIVATRTRLGDWEGDTVESKDHKPGINTLVERKSGLVFMTKLKDKTALATKSAVRKRFQGLPSHLKYTLTLDNGTENSDWQSMEKESQIKVFFAHPYRSSERGTNENTNGLIREYFPKKTDFTTIPEEEIARIEYKLNTRPRKRLNFKTPLEVFSVALQG